MNNYELTIKLKTITDGTEKINQTASAVEKLDNAGKKATTSSNNFGKSLQSLGSRVNVLGQRMTGMLTLPLVMFANQAIDTAVKVETGWARFDKVFSGTEDQMASLRKVGTDFSTKFGVAVEDVAGVMGEFSKAGVDSEESLKSLTDQALQTSILFDTDLTSAFEGVKAVMFGFGLNSEDTRKALAAINMVADKTTTSEQDILDVMQRAGGVFKQHNIGVTEASALTSLLAQSNIKGAIAGNSLKSVITGMDMPTKKATDSMAAFGLDIRGTAFRTASFTDKLKMLNVKQSEVFAGGNKSKIADWNEALGAIGGKLQISRLDTLVEKIGQVDGVMELAGDETKNLKYWNEQLATVMQSSPQKLAIMNEMYRNQQAIIGNELLPVKMKLLDAMTKVLDKFNSLSPATQNWILIALGIVAVAGPVLMVIGLFTTLLGFMSPIATGMWALVVSMGAKGLLGSTVALIGPLAALKLALVTLGVPIVITIGIGSILLAIQAAKDLKSAMDSFTSANNSALKSNQNILDKASKMDKNDPKRKKLLDAAKNAADQQKKIAEDLVKGLSWSSLLGFNNGGVVYASNGFLSKGRDTVPAMLSPGEMVLNKSQQSTLFDVLQGKTQMATDGGPVINISVGNMIASRGEQREFARKITELLNENSNRK